MKIVYEVGTDEDMSCIYTLSIEGEEVRYVGQTSVGLSERYRESRVRSGSVVNKPRLCGNWLSKNWDNVVCTAIEVCPPDELNDREIYWIKHYGTLRGDDNPNGLNLTQGGETTRGYQHTEETKKKISDRAKQRYIDNPEIWKSTHTKEALEKKRKTLNAPEHKQLMRDLSTKQYESAEYREQHSKQMREWAKNNPDKVKYNVRGPHNRWHAPYGVISVNCIVCVGEDGLDDTQKYCNHCRSNLPLTDFHKNRSGKSGLQARCKKCSKPDKK